MENSLVPYPTLDETWSIVARHLSSKGASDQSIQSFDNFIHRAFPQAIYRLFHVDTQLGLDLSKHFSTKITNVVCLKPLLLNNDINVSIPENLSPTAENARLLRSSLVVPVYVSLQLQLDKTVEKITNLLLCYMPLMVGSSLTTGTHTKKELTDDGYFVLNGQEKMLVAQEKKLDRAILVSGNRCIYKNPTVNPWWLEKDAEGFISVNSKHGTSSVAYIFAFYDMDLTRVFPLSVRMETEALMNSVSPEECFAQFKKVFPHSSNVDISFLFGSKSRSLLDQLSYMCYSLKKGIDVYDRDHLQNKRVEMPCELLMTIAEKSLRRVSQSFQRRIVNYIEKNPTKNMVRGVQRALDARVVTESFFYALSTGNFPSVGGIATGVAQQRSNYNFSSKLSQARRIHSGDEKRNILGQREVRGDHKGYLSPFDTQEGRSCGCSKSFAMLTTVSIEFDHSVIETCLDENPVVEFLEHLCVDSYALVFVNGIVSRQCKSTNDLVLLKNHILQYRRCGIIDYGVSILIRRRNLYVRTDGGRILRPLFVVQNLHRHMETSLRNLSDERFSELLSSGIVEYVSSGEEDTKQVAENFQCITKHTELCEIHPTLILSFNSNYGAPFCNNNQGPRITYQNAMMKQAQSQIPVDFKSNMKSRSHSLLYGQKPLATTKLAQVEGFPQSSGLNCIVCLGTFDSYNCEDSLIINRAFIDRGGFRSLDQKTFTYTGNEIVSNLSSTAPWKKHDTTAFNHLDDDGMPCPRTVVTESDIILCKHATDEEGEKMDTSSKARDKKGVIERVIFGHGQRRKKSSAAQDSIKVNVTTYEARRPIVGDKLASRHAQKGVIAQVVDPEDLPFTMDGINPDIIINPCCIPTRMTIGQLLEMVGSKAAALNGNIEDATAFTHPTVEELTEKLKQAGFQKYGDECMMDGKTGEMLKAKMFIGCCYYQRLKHMVDDKIHARSETGPRSMLTRQPPSGRSNNGGHRIGEMESVAIIASGSSLVHHTLWNQSDKSDWRMCRDCSLYNPLVAGVCHSCGSSNLENITVPYSFKLLQQELYQCGIMIRDKSAAGEPHVLGQQKSRLFVQQEEKVVQL